MKGTGTEMMSEFQCIRLRQADDVSVIRIVDDKVQAPDRIAILGEELMSFAGKDNNHQVVLNLDNVRFLSSAAINKLVLVEHEKLQ